MIVLKFKIFNLKKKEKLNFENLDVYLKLLYGKVVHLSGMILIVFHLILYINYKLRK